jgi:hypothetical protein
VALKFRNVFLAEGVTFDARGSLALVGVEPRAFFVPKTSTQLGLFVVAIFEEDENEPRLSDGDSARVSCEVASPDETTVFHAELSQELTIDRDLPIPFRMQFASQVAFPASKPGTYTARVSLSLNDAKEQLTSSVKFNVLEQPVQGA